MGSPERPEWTNAGGSMWQRAPGGDDIYGISKKKEEKKDKKGKPPPSDPEAHGCGRWIEDGTDDIFAKEGPMDRD